MYLKQKLNNKQVSCYLYQSESKSLIASKSFYSSLIYGLVTIHNSLRITQCETLYYNIIKFPDRF